MRRILERTGAADAHPDYNSYEVIHMKSTDPSETSGTEPQRPSWALENQLSGTVCLFHTAFLKNRRKTKNPLGPRPLGPRSLFKIHLGTSLTDGLSYTKLL